MTETCWEERMALRAAARRAAAPDPPADPPVPWRTEQEAAEDRAAYCEDCTELFIDGPHGWAVRLTCGMSSPAGCRLGHAHHTDEIWLA